jgi:hypothetical protein
MEVGGNPDGDVGLGRLFTPSEHFSPEPVRVGPQRHPAGIALVFFFQGVHDVVQFLQFHFVDEVPEITSNVEMDDSHRQDDDHHTRQQKCTEDFIGQLDSHVQTLPAESSFPFVALRLVSMED